MLQFPHHVFIEFEFKMTLKDSLLWGPFSELPASRNIMFGSLPCSPHKVWAMNYTTHISTCSIFLKQFFDGIIHCENTSLLSLVEASALRAVIDFSAIKFHRQGC